MEVFLVLNMIETLAKQGVKMEVVMGAQHLIGLAHIQMEIMGHVVEMMVQMICLKMLELEIQLV